MLTTMDLYNSFKEVYKNETALAPYSNRNLYSTIHLSENDHTQILWDIIRYRKNGKYVFFKSFIKDCLGIDTFEMNEEIDLSKQKATQYPSLSNKNESSQNTKKYGFIDLLLQYKDKVIIIENKVCDASDGKNQLARYFYTFAKIKDKEENENLKSAGITSVNGTSSFTDENIFVVYLTKDNSKTFPTEKSCSLPSFLKKRLRLVNDKEEPLDTNSQDTNIPNASHYIHISYSENVVNWIKENVLPEISAYNSNEFYQSVALYVDYLENDLLGQTQKSRDIYIADDYNKIVDSPDTEWCKVWLNLYGELVKQKDTNKKDEDLQVRNAYIIFLRAQLNRILNGKLKDGWKAYCTPSFILLYKEEWRKLSPNTDIPVLNLYLSPSFIKNLLIDNNKKNNNNNISFNIERVKSDKPEWKSKLIGDLKDKYTCTITNREQVYRYKEAYSIKKIGDSLSINLNCKYEKIETALSNIIK